MTPQQIEQLTPRDIKLIEISHMAGLRPDEISTHDGMLAVSATGARKLCALATRAGTTTPEQVRGLLDHIGYHEALARQQRRRPPIITV